MLTFGSPSNRGIRGEVEELVDFYNLDMIIAVGYRVSSPKATKFRQWSTKILNGYIKKGFVLDDDRLKQGTAVFGKDYFRKLLEKKCGNLRRNSLTSC